MDLVKFCSLISDFNTLSHNDRIILFGWYIHTFMKQSRFDVKDVSSLYEAVSLAPPGNFWQHFRDLNGRKPKKLLKDKSGYFLEKRAVDNLFDAYPAISDFTNKPKTNKARVDLTLIVALREELSEIHSQHPDWTPVRVEATGGFDYLIHCPSNDPKRPYHCIVAFVADMTSTPSAIETGRVIQDWNPLTVVNIGLCGSLENDILLGDVVIADVADDYLARGRANLVNSGNNAESPDWDFQLGGESFRPSIDFINLAKHFEFAHSKEHTKWKAECKGERTLLVPPSNAQVVEESKLPSSPSIRVGHLASGPVVSGAESFGKWLKSKRDRNYIAIEMESAGVMAAVHKHVDPKKAFVIKAVSDFADERKKDLDSSTKNAIRGYAMRNALRLLKSMMELGVFPKGDVAIE